MPAAGGGNTRAKQKKRSLTPHGPGGTLLRAAPKPRSTPRTPAAKRRGIRVVQRAAGTTPARAIAPTRNQGGGNTRAKQVARLVRKTKTGTPHEVRQSYRALPLEQRQKLVRKIERKYGLLSDDRHAALSRHAEPTRQDRSVMIVHSQRAREDAKALASPFANKRQSELIDDFKHSDSYLATLDEAQRAGEKYAEAHKPKRHKADIYETDPHKLKALGFKQEGTVDKLLKAPIGALVSGAAVVKATAHDPIGVPSKTAKQGLDAAFALPGGLVDLATHPKKTVTAQVEAFADRSSQKFEDRVKTIRKKGGLDYGFDAALVAAPETALTRGAVRAGLRRGLEPRAALRVTGGTAKARKDRGYLRDAAGSAVDKRRAAKHERQLKEAEAGGAPVDALVQQAAEANRRAGRVVEVVGRRAGAKQVRGVAKDKGRGTYSFKHDQGTRLGAARKLINKLDKNEKRALYYATLGIRTPEQATAMLSRLEKTIEHTRSQTGIEVKGSLKKSDMLPDIEKILAAPEAHFTPKLAATIDALAPDARRAGHEDPSFDDAIDRQRRHAPLADLLGLERGVGHETPAPAAKPKITAEEMAKYQRRLKDAPEAKKKLAAFQEKHPELLQVLNKDTPLSREESALQTEYHKLRNAADPQPMLARSNGVPPHRYADETDAAFADRIAATAKEHGLAEPLYFKSERYVGPRDFAAHAVGLKNAMKSDQRYKGENLRQGLQDTRPEQFLRGNARSIKRAHNWELVATVAEKNSIPELTRNGTTVSAIHETAAKLGVDPNSFALWNPGVMRRFAEQHAGDAVDERFINGEELDGATIQAGLQHSVIRLDKHGRAVDGTGAAADAGELAKSSGWQAVPDPVLKEIEAQMVPSGKGARSWDIAKGKASRAMLLAGNVPWLTFQVASNAAMGAAATGGRLLNPANWLGAHQWWKDMTPEEQQRTGAMLGLDATAADSHQHKIGAATNNDVVNAYRAFKAHPFWHTGVAGGRGPSISELNPFELMAAADRGQNNVFRIVAGYSLAKRDAVRKMGESMGHAERAQAKLTSIIAMPPREALEALRRDPHLMEDHGEAIADWMGDYTTMTAHERKVINRVVMFYPYLRYSLKLMFYTLPVKHPAVTAVLADLGSMKAEELRKLLGSDNLPWNIGKIYFGSDGDVKSIDMRRANPALNAVIDAAHSNSLSQLVGIMPPYVQWITDQAYQKSSFTGKDFKVQGHPNQFGGPHLSALDPLRARILANDALGLMFPYRAAGHLHYNPVKDGPIPFVDGGTDDRLAGTQGDDSLLFAPRPTHYGGKHPNTLAKLQKKFADRREAFKADNESLIHELIPMLPTPDRSKAESRENKILAKAQQPAKKKRKKSGYKFGGSKGYKFK